MRVIRIWRRRTPGWASSPPLYDYDWPEAARCFALATSQDARLRHWNGYFHLRFIGRAAEAVAEHEAALRDDPLNLIGRVGHIMTLISAGRRAEADAASTRLAEINPAFSARYTLLAFDVANAPLDAAIAFAEQGYTQAGWGAGATGCSPGSCGARERRRDPKRWCASSAIRTNTAGRSTWRCFTWRLATRRDRSVGS